jgi:hypothetical protein
VDLFSLIPNAEVRLLEIFSKTDDGILHRKVVLVNGAQKKRAQFVFTAEFKKFSGVRQFANGTLGLPELAMKPGLQLWKRNVGRVFVVKSRERKAEFRAKFLEGNLRAIGLGQDVVGGLPHRGQIIDERAGPVEDYIANHEGKLTALAEKTRTLL